MNHVIACDLGSNTLRIVEINCQNGERIQEFERIVRTAKGLHVNGCISDEAIHNITNAFKEASQLFDFQSLPVRCVTTEAMRQARNAEDVLSHIKKSFGLEFEIIDGKQEAFFTQIGVESALKRLNLPQKDYLLMDLGGGSMELTCKAFSHSFPIGIVSIAEKYRSLENIQQGTQEALLHVKEFKERLFTCKPQTFIATAGTPTTVAAFLQGMAYSAYAHQKVTGTVLTCKDYLDALDRLLALPKNEREYWVGVGRDDLIIAGIIIVVEVMKYFSYPTCLVIDDGLREGVALSKCNTNVF